jgi:hypothetical protein
VMLHPVRKCLQKHVILNLTSVGAYKKKIKINYSR